MKSENGEEGWFDTATPVARSWRCLLGTLTGILLCAEERRQDVSALNQQSPSGGRDPKQFSGFYREVFLKHVKVLASVLDLLFVSV